MFKIKHLMTGSLLMVLALSSASADEKINYPQTRKTDVKDTFYGTVVADPYRWLEDDNSPETAAWVTAQNKVTFNYLHALPGREAIKERLTKLWNYERIGTPFTKAGKWFFFRNDGLQNQSVLYVMDDLNETPRVLLDPNTLSEDGTVAYSDMDVSPDGKYLVYMIARSGSDWKEIYVMDTDSGKLLDDHLLWVKFSEIACQGDGFYYSAYDKPAAGTELSQSNSYQKIYFHRYGTDQAEDELIYSNPDNAKRMYTAEMDDSGRYLFILEQETTSGNGLYVKDLKHPEKGFVQVAAGFDHDYIPLTVRRGKILLLTNDAALRYRVIALQPGESEKHELIPECENTIEDVSVCGGKLFVKYMQDVSSHIRIFSLRGKAKGEMELPGICSVENVNGSRRGRTLFYDVSSYNTPGTIYRYDTRSGRSEEYFRPELSFDPDDFDVKQVFYKSKDGTPVPMTLLYKKGMKRDGNNPTLLYGYGGFNVSLTPGFAKSSLFFAEQGGIFAVANLRGGGEYGEAWHEAGTKMKKQTVFDDFIAAAEYLIDENYTNPEKLAARGGSNGGLLMGAVTNQRPDLFKAVLPAVGVMDMLRYHKFTIGYAWAGDYGTVDDSEAMFRYLLAYSPVHTVKAQEYPAMMVTTADHDDRVVPAHSFKYISAVQDKHTGNAPVLIRVGVKAGHGRGKPTAMVIEEYTDMFAFLFEHLGMEMK